MIERPCPNTIPIGNNGETDPCPFVITDDPNSDCRTCPDCGQLVLVCKHNSAHFCSRYFKPHPLCFKHRPNYDGWDEWDDCAPANPAEHSDGDDRNE